VALYPHKLLTSEASVLAPNIAYLYKFKIEITLFNYLYKLSSILKVLISLDFSLKDLFKFSIKSERDIWSPPIDLINSFRFSSNGVLFNSYIFFLASTTLSISGV
jgi:hypothetical protein